MRRRENVEEEARNEITRAARVAQPWDITNKHQSDGLRRDALQCSAVFEELSAVVQLKSSVPGVCCVLKRPRLPAWFPQHRGNATSSIHSSETPPVHPNTITSTTRLTQQAPIHCALGTLESATRTRLCPTCLLFRHALHPCHRRSR
jgi:hypothetical protein